LEVARLCFGAGYYDWALTAAYYCAYQSALAALEHFQVPIDEEGATYGQRWEHATVPPAIVEHLGWSEEWDAMLRETYNLRVIASYETDVTKREEAERIIAFAEEVLQRALEEVPE
jgi:uncharacterized protein (UPF0332 family)